MAPVTTTCDDELQLEGILFVVGDALLDVFADVTCEFLETRRLQHGRAIVANDQHQGQFTADCVQQCVFNVLCRNKN